MRGGRSGVFDWQALGAMLAEEGDQEQIAFFRSFADEILRWPVAMNRDWQMLEIAKHLNKDQKYIIGTIAFDEKAGE